MVAFLIYATGLLLIASVAWAVASPWWSEAEVAPAEAEALPRGQERWRKQKDEALSAIKDAEFDFQLGKLSETDYHQLRARLETQALEAMSVLEKKADGDS
jgi:hypothetical protein